MATLAVLSEARVPPLLYNLVFGESVLNDAGAGRASCEEGGRGGGARGEQARVPGQLTSPHGVT